MRTRAVAPLVGISVGTAIDLGDGLRVRNAATGELAAHWPEAQGLLPPDFGRETDRLAVIELERSLRKGEPEPPDAPGELADAVTALRLVTAGPVAAGPVLFERLDWRPYGIRPVLPIAATQPDGEPTRLDEFRGRLAGDIRGRLLAADEDQALGEALDRWELSLFQADPFQARAAARVAGLSLRARRRSVGRVAACGGAAGRDPGGARPAARAPERRLPSARPRPARSRRGRHARRPRQAARDARRVARRARAAAGGIFRTSGSKLTHDRAYGGPMDEARAVVERLNRIEALDREGAPAATLLAELRELVREAEAWVQVEHEPERAVDAVERCKAALERQILTV